MGLRRRAGTRPKREAALLATGCPSSGASVAICYFITALNVGVGPAITLGASFQGAIPAVFMLAVMYGAGTLERLLGHDRLAVSVILGLFVSAVAVQQGLSSPVCVLGEYAR